jgi:hypothetical protein
MNDSRQNDLSRHYESTNKSADDMAALQNRLNLLKMTAREYKLFSVEYEIDKILKSLRANNPKPKILKAIARKIEILSAQIQMIEQRKYQQTR